jgi:hypothetical protein
LVQFRGGEVREAILITYMFGSKERRKEVFTFYYICLVDLGSVQSQISDCMQSTAL